MIENESFHAAVTLQRPTHRAVIASIDLASTVNTQVVLAVEPVVLDALFAYLRVDITGRTLADLALEVKAFLV